MFCGHCRAENTADNRFCVGCGADLESQHTPAPSEPSASDAGSAGATRLEPSAETADLAVGSLLDRDRYRLDSVLGTGGMGTAYRATDLKLGQVVALKIIHGHLLEGTAGIERLRNEVRIARELQHPGIVRVYELGSDQGREFFTMELVEGPTLREFLEQRSEPLSLEEAKTVLLPLLDALAYAHQQTVHRDVKPENVLLVGGGLGQPKLVDFGIAKSIVGEALTRTALALGTPEYVAPEQARDAAHVDHRADLYSVGVMLYEMVTGERPVGRFRLPSELRPDLSEALDRVVDRLLQPHADDRPESAEAVKATLEEMRAASEAGLAPKSSDEETPGEVPDERAAPVEVSAPGPEIPPDPKEFTIEAKRITPLPVVTGKPLEGLVTGKPLDTANGRSTGTEGAESSEPGRITAADELGPASVPTSADDAPSVTFRQLVDYAYDSDGLDMDKGEAAEWAESKLSFFEEHSFDTFRQLVDYAYDSDGLDMTSEEAVEWAVPIMERGDAKKYI